MDASKSCYSNEPFLLSAIGAVQGMEMRQKDADDFRGGLLSSFPDLANSDFLTVKPAGDRLEVILDFNGFFEGLDPKTFRMAGFGPWSFFFPPQDMTANGQSMTGPNGTDQQ